MTDDEKSALDHPYTWGDLRERKLETLPVGTVVFKPDMMAAYMSGGPEGKVCGLSWVLNGSAWTITSREDDTYTFVRRDGKAAQTATLRGSIEVLAVVTEPRSTRARRTAKKKLS